jgi:ATP-dependent Clp protease ATP-binding subunit ClpC
MNGNVTPKVKEILKIATTEAKAYDYRRVEPAHLLIAILLDNTNRCIDILKQMGGDIDKIFNEVSDHLTKNNLTPVVMSRSGQVPLSTDTVKILSRAVEKSKKYNSDEVDVEHLMIALLEFEGVPKQILNDNQISVIGFFVQLNNDNLNINNMDEFDDLENNLSVSNKSKGDSKTPVLDNFCRDITLAVKEGKIDAVIGRDNEIKRIAQILCRRKKNNPILLGEAGVGKTSIAEGLAKQIVEGDCPSSLMEKKLYALDLASLIAGTKYRGQFESRMKTIVEELRDSEDIILFIDEIHTIVGAGNSTGSLDVSNIIKPALARGEFQVIGATTLDEYRENFETDAALTRRFQKVMVKEPNLEETLIILENIKDKYEDYHKVSYSDEAIRECVTLSDRYITDRSMPDKAIDILDEVGASTNTNLVKPDEIKSLEERMIQIRQDKDMVVKKQQYEDAAKLREEEKKINLAIIEAKAAWMDSIDKKRTPITVEMVTEVVSMTTGIPLKKLSTEENKKLAKMEGILKSRVIGQDDAVTRISKAIRRNKLGLRDKDKPIGTFICVGKSGSGKTLLTKVIAEYIFNDPDSLIRIDMSEYMEKFSVSRLIGAPPGYVGYEEGGKLTEAVRRRPHSVILFDEIEKAHPDVFNIMLQLLDEGFLTDSLGRKVNFRNTLVILTSNVGVKELSNFGTSMGFETSNSIINEQKKAESILNKAIKKQFSPEFLNRIDDVIVFNELTQDDILKIVSLEIDKVKVRIEEMGYQVKISKPAMEFLAEKGYHKEYGARPLARAIQKYVEDGIAEEIISDRIKEGELIKIGYSKKNDELTFTT